jgi:hypothetical protein
LEVRDLHPLHPITRPLHEHGRIPWFKVGREIRQIEGVESGVRWDMRLLRTRPTCWLEERVLRPGMAEASVDYQAPQPQEAYSSRCIGAVADIDAAEQGGRAGHLVLITASGFDNLSMRLTGNGDLALNLFNWLAEREALVSIRGNKYVARQLELAPQQLERIFWVQVAGVPGVLLVLGLLVLWRRTRS